MDKKYTKWTQNIPTSSMERPSKIYQNWDFMFEKQMYHLAALSQSLLVNDELLQNIFAGGGRRKSFFPSKRSFVSRETNASPATVGDADVSFVIISRVSRRQGDRMSF
jgi:hypothetical protein